MSTNSSTAAKRPFATKSAGWRRASKPWETVVAPYLNDIYEMHRRRLSLRKIAEQLLRNHGLKVAHSTIASALDIRKKERKVKSIHPSFLNHPKKTAVTAGMAHEDPIERLRRKSVVKQKVPTGDWDKQLEVNGPLAR